MRLLDFRLLQRSTNILFTLFLIMVPTQLGKHFWPDFSIVSGLRIDYLSPTLYLTDILIILLATIWGIEHLKRNRNKASFAHAQSLHRNTSIKILFSCFVGYLFLNSLISENFLNSLYHLLKFMECAFVAFFVATTVRDHYSRQTMAICFAIGVIGESFLAIAQYLQQGAIGGLLYFLGERSFNAGTPGIANASINGELVMRAYGTFSHPNVLAGYLVISMVCIIGFLFVSTSTGKKQLAYGAVLIGTAALLLTLSRVAIALWVLFLFSIAVREFALNKKQSKNSRAKVISLGAIFLAGLLLIFSFFHPVVGRFLQTTITEESVVQRSMLIGAAVKIIQAHPFFGVGFGNFLPVVSSQLTPLSISYTIQPVHNIFLLVAAETGVIGSVFFLALLVLCYRRIITEKHWTAFVALSIVLVLGLTDHYFLTLQQGQLLFAIMVGLCFTSGKEAFNLGAAKITRS